MNNDLWTDGQALTAPRASSRRGFILGSAAAGLGAGFAIASGPVRGQAIKTDFEGITSDEIRIGRRCTAFRPTSPGPAVRCETLHDSGDQRNLHLRCSRVHRRRLPADLRNSATPAIAPDLFVRAGDPTEFGTIAEIQSNIVAKTPDRQSPGRPEVLPRLGHRPWRRSHTRWHHRLLLGWTHHLACLRPT